MAEVQQPVRVARSGRAAASAWWNSRPAAAAAPSARAIICRAPATSVPILSARYSTVVCVGTDAARSGSSSKER